MSSIHEIPAISGSAIESPVEFRESEFTGRIILVVGGSRGIGAEVARLATSLGASEVIVNSREQSRDEAIALLEELEKVNINSGNLSRYIAGDITVSGVPESIVQQAALSGRLDDVIICAGIRDDGLFLNMNDEQIRRVMEANFFGPAFVAREAIKQMRRQRPRGGSITFISSLAAEGNPGQANYSASKGAINSLVKTLAKEYSGSGIRINAVAPGLVETTLTAGLTPQQRTGLLEATHSDRALTALEVARHVLYLASPTRDSSVTGQIVPIVGLGIK